MLSWGSLSLRQKLGGLFLLILFAAATALGIVTGYKEVPFASVQGVAVICNVLGIACVGLGALLDPGSFSEKPFRFPRKIAPPRVCILLGWGGLLLLLAGVIL